MVFTVLSQDIVPALNSLVSARQVINFTIESDELKLQALEPIINDKVVKINSIIDKSGNNSISVKLNESFNLLEAGEVTFMIAEDGLFIMSSDYRSRFVVEYEERFINKDNVVEEVEVNINTFGHISRIAHGVSIVSDSIGVDTPPIIFRDNRAYMLISNMVWSMTTKFYDCMLSASQLRAINKSLPSKSIYNLQLYGKERNYASIQYGDNDKISFAIKHDNSEIINIVNNIISGLKKVGVSTIVSLSDKLKVIEKLYKKEPVTAYIGKYGFRVELSQGTTSFLSVGRQKDSDILAILKTSVPIISLINKVFGDSQFDVLIGGRYVCLKSNTQYLLLTGLQ